MKPTIYVLAGVGASALALAACTPPHPHHHADAMLKTISTLDCPDSQGDLTRKSQSADGKTCVYANDSGADVTLQLVALNGQDAKTALAPLEAQLKSELPPSADTKADTKADGGGDNGRVDIDLPGIHIHANGKNDDAKIDVGGGTNKLVIKNGQSITTTTSGPGISIDAHDKNAQISINESGSGVRVSYILASDNPGPNGYKVIGYEARGPSAGPIAVVSVKSKSDDADDLRDDARDLLRLNVGG